LPTFQQSINCGLFALLDLAFLHTAGTPCGGFRFRSAPAFRISDLITLSAVGLRRLGLNPEEILTREALTQAHTTIIDRNQLEQSQLHQLTTALKQQMLKEIRENQPVKSINSCLSNGPGRDSNS